MPVTYVAAPDESNISYSDLFLEPVGETAPSLVVYTQGSIKALTSLESPYGTPSKASKSDIREYIRYVFGEHGEDAIKIADCETGLNPFAVNEADALITGKISTGLFQHNENYFIGWDDYRTSTDKAYEKFQARGWRPWLNCAKMKGLI